MEKLPAGKCLVDVGVQESFEEKYHASYINEKGCYHWPWRPCS